MGSNVFQAAASGFTVYHFAAAAGFAAPPWNDYPAVNMGAATPVAKWLLSNDLPYNSNLQDDADGDGVSLLLAYALNLDPKRNLSGSLPRPVATPNHLSLTFYAGSEGVTYTVEASTDLHAWSAADVTVSAPDANNFRTASVPLTHSMLTLRLKVSTIE